MQEPLISIITPTYNHERFIAQCIESVLGQTYTSWEMIVVDDGSSDRTWPIVQAYAAKDKRIRPFRQENKGIWRLSETYNLALAQSRGQLIAILEGDDVWTSAKLAVQVPFHLSNGYALSFGQIQLIDISGDRVSTGTFPDREETVSLLNSDANERCIRHLRGEYGVPALTVLINRESLIRIGGFQQTDYLPLVDYPTWLSIGSTHNGYGFIDQVLGFWRQFVGQTTWLLARDIAHGMYRFAQAFAASRQLDVVIAPGVSLEKSLLSQGRRNYLSDACYRSAAVAFDRGQRKQAWSYCAEIARYGQYSLFLRCLGAFAWKFARKSLASRPVRRDSYA